MEIVLDMPVVKNCQALRCVYNHHRVCHARAITVGGDSDHACDTMLIAVQHARRMEIAGVGACKVSACVYNDDFECQAEGIEVGFTAGEAVCATFSPR